jgi:hypothetical protein
MDGKLEGKIEHAENRQRKLQERKGKKRKE